MRNVLFIAYDFPPGRGIGAGLRSAYFVRHLPAFGWNPDVVALENGQTGQPDVVRLASATPWQRPYEVTPYGWAFALRRWLKASRGRRWDLVYVSCPPYPQALAAAAYARRQALPLVVDFRDAWSLDPYQEGSRLKRALYRYVFPHLERRLLSGTSLLLLNTPSALAAYQGAYPEQAPRMAHLPNGFDEAAFTGCRGPAEGNDRAMHLLYAGRFGIGGRSPQRLLDALEQSRSRGCQLVLDIVGRQPAGVMVEIGAAEAAGLVRTFDEVAYTRATEMMCQADGLALIQAPSAGSVQAVAGKTYDYLRSGRPVFAVAPEGDNLALIRTHASAFESSNDSVGDMTDALERLYRRWHAGEFNDAGQPDPEFVARYERRALTRELASHFDRLAAGVRG